ncbi:ATPase [Erythrobacter sp. HKB08]|uniref:ATPase n=1 Tax=Erythrobacter sp. HKB08 TaxID=2502843 RepID=UPI001008BD21|nr:ATPase [Erythrobacter sp. HKB08]
MTGGSNIRAIGPDAPAEAEVSEGPIEETTLETSEEDIYEEWEEEVYSGPSKLRFVAPTLAVLLAAGWTGFFGWAYRTEIMSQPDPQGWVSLIAAWSMPVALIVGLWLLAMRNSRREAIRFGEVAATLSDKSAELEQRLSVVNRELSLAREFLAAQSRELESLGRVASERLSENADRLQALVVQNGEQVDAIANVSTTALDNMNRLRDDLPVIANSARDVSNQIGSAGRTAHGQIAELVSGFERLNEFGKASEQQVETIRARIEAALGTFETQTAEMEELAEARFGALREQSEQFRTELDGREVEALAAMRRRADALAEEFAKTRSALEDEEEEALRSLRARLMAMREEAQTVSSSVSGAEETALAAWKGRVEQLDGQLREAIAEIQRIDQAALESANRKLDALREEAEAVDDNIAQRDRKLLATILQRHQLIADREKQAIEQMTEQLDQFDAALEEKRAAQLAHAEEIAERGDAVAERIEHLRTTLAEMAESGSATQQSLAENTDAIVAKLTEGRSVMEGIDASVAQLTEASVRLLELIQASSEHTSKALPATLTDAETRLTAAKEHANELRAVIGEAGMKSEDLSSYVITARDTNRAAIHDLDGLSHRLGESFDEHDKRIAALRENLESFAGRSDELGEQARSALQKAVEALEEAVAATPDKLETLMGERIERITESVGSTTADAVEKALQESVTSSLVELEAATDRATGAGREVTVQLRDQLAKVNELAGNLETRVARAREMAEEEVGNDFARRVALITEALNSNSIDIAKSLSEDVSDTAWASYLRGDRGIFTRRAVRLLDNSEAREIAEIYDTDPDFRENVSRYIHDFEAMLRTMLSTRDGNALGVTLLSSDMGKLYVALAQAIERLRD